MNKRFYTFIIVLLSVFTAIAQEENISDTIGKSRNTEIVVGSIGGSVDVSGLGGATYTIPIQVPDGLGGIQPNMAICYNSQGGNGLLGWCWDFQGISSITRLGTTLYHDGSMSGVDFEDDRFALDGQRLICLSSHYGSNGAEYRTEVDVMAKIVSYTSNGINGPTYFKVWLPNGNIAYYGNSQDSRITLQQNDAVCLWLLNRLEDRNGNYMTYYYSIVGSNYTLSQISYGGNSNANINCSYSVQFSYSPRTDEEKTFIGDNHFDHNRILDSITIKRSNVELYKYRFTYFAPNFSNGYYYNRLKQIDFSCGNECYNPTVIDWGNNDYGNTTTGLTKNIRLANWVSPNFYNRIKFTGDFNGDGYTDLLLYIDNPNAGKSAIFYINKGVVDGEQVFQTHTNGISLDNNIDWIYVADVNGDGLDDVTLSSRNRTWIGKDILTIDTYISSVDGQGNFGYSLANKHFGDFKIKKKYKESILVGDFLGEGKQSFLLQEGEDNRVNPRMFYITYDGAMLMETELPSSMVLDVDRMFACDFNGDGISEIYYSDENSNATGLKRIRKSGSVYYYEQVNNGMLSPWHQLFPGDFNGDGKMDLLTYEDDGNSIGEWHIQYFRETELSWPAFDISIQTMGIGNPGNHGYSLKYLNEAAYQFITVGDFNGDGKSDIAVRTSNNQMKFLYAPLKWENGVAQFASSQTVNLSDMGLSGVSNQGICVGNFLGQENMSLFNSSTLYCLNPLTNRYSVTAITDGMGNCNRFVFDYLMPKASGVSESDFYRRTRQSSEEQAYSMFTISLPMKGLQQVSTFNINCPERSASVVYRYQNAMVHKRGRGFLGFKAITVESYLDITRQQTTEQVFDHYQPLSTPYLGLKTTIVKNTTGNTLSITENTGVILNKYHSSDTRIFVPIVTKQISNCNDPDDNAGTFMKKVIVENTYNDFFVSGNNVTRYYDILKQTDTKQGIDARSTVNSVNACEFQTITQTDFVNETTSLISAWVINRPWKVLKTYRRLSEYQDVKSLSTYSYSPSPSSNPFQPIQIIHYPSGIESPSDPLATVETFNYYQTGSVASTTFHDLAHSLPQKFSLFEYSADGRFLTKKTNAAGYETRYEYNDNYGFLTKETDCNGLITRYQKTPLGVSSTVDYPDGTSVQSEISWIEANDANAPRDASYYQRSIRTGESETRSYFDATGAKLRTMTPGMTTELVYKDYNYNEKGLLVRESLPYFGNVANAPVYWTTYQYDNYNRPTMTEHPDGLAESNLYHGLTTHHVYWTDPDYPSATSTTVNVAGWTVENRDEDGNTVQYDYRPDGSLMWAQLGNDTNTKIKLGYDNAGNRVSLSDPNYGESESLYDAYGQLVWTRTPKSNYTTYEYDTLGRMVKRYEHDVQANAIDSTIYSYSRNQGTLGLLENISFNGKQQNINYYYDNVNRVSIVSETRISTHYNTSYTYDFASRVASVTYPTGFQMNKEYTATGHLSALTDSVHLPLWKTLSKNAVGQIERYMTGDSLYTKRTYDPENGRLTGIKTWHGNDTVQKLSYSYDLIANLAARIDQVHDMEENFLYDDLNRLTGIVENHDTTARFVYDAYGRMVGKYMHNAMVFNYAVYNAGGRPHAIAEADTYVDLPRHQMSYNHSDKLATITQDTLTLGYGYGFEHQRLHMAEANTHGDTLRKKTYVGNCEYVDNGLYTTKRTYLSGPLGVFGVMEKREGGRPDRYYIHPDHLGSWTLITDGFANVLQDVTYDAWGTPYCFTSTGTESAASLLFDRGFTGHEHLFYFGLINMNGRMYDPVTSSFLSVDNYVQSPDYTQSFNRYAYCLNNPLKYTDPDGEYWNIIIGAAIGGIANLAFNWNKIDTFGEGLAYFGIGTAAGALGAFAGGAVAGAINLGGFISGAVSGAVGGASSGMVTGSGNAWMQGANFGQGLKAGAIAAGIGAGTGAVLGGLSRGIMDYSKGFDFWDGSITEEFSSGTINNDPIWEDYNSTSNAELNDSFLKSQVQREFNVSEGDFGIKEITTKSSNYYKVTSTGRYLNTKTGYIVEGYHHHYSTGVSEIHISSHITLGDMVDFKAVVGHELIHAYHHYFIPNCSTVFSERVAYEYSCRIYATNGQLSKAMAISFNAATNPSGCFWGTYPLEYANPYIYKIW